MSIEALSLIHSLADGVGMASVVALEDRLKGSERVNSSANQSKADVPDADYEAFYAALLGAEEGFNAQEFLRNYVDAQGEKPFMTISAQMEVLQKVMAQLKEEGQQGSPSYEQASKAFGSAFSMNFMLAEFRREAMNPSNDEESRENIVW